VQDAREAPAHFRRVDGPDVIIHPVPYYIGPRDYVRQRGKIIRAIRSAIGPSDAVILRVPGAVSNALEPILLPHARPFGAEVVADPMDGYAKSGVGHPLRRYFRWSFTRRLKRQCAAASATAYVTRETLQRRYPPRQDTFATHYTSLELSEDAFVAGPRSINRSSTAGRLVLVGSLTQRYKGVDVLIDAMAACRLRGVEWKLDVLGDGKHRSELERRTESLDMNKQVTFRGHISAGPAVREFLDRADIFVLPSLTEGLPRAMIEAMARALPCIGSTIGGIPELLPAEDLVEPGSVESLTNKLMEFATDPQRRQAASMRNLKNARPYAINVVKKRRDEFYLRIKEITAAWTGGA
jgi:glycosyltransferase involved in cell wall biosynthesis